MMTGNYLEDALCNFSGLQSKLRAVAVSERTLIRAVMIRWKIATNHPLSEGHALR